MEVGLNVDVTGLGGGLMVGLGVGLMVGLGDGLGVGSEVGLDVVGLRVGEFVVGDPAGAPTV